jgi:DNA-binding CsgD family transcriptional regulator/tetratricopeptide (TPR) repeat protein
MDGNVRIIRGVPDQSGGALLRELGGETTVRLSDGREMLNDVSNRSVSPIFVGRQYELARLRSAFVRTVTGEPQAVLIGGEAGIGKSRLVEEFTARLDATVAVGACIELGSGDGVPFGPFAAALRSLDGRGLIDRESWEGRELARILPELGEAPPRRQEDEYARIRLFEAVQAALLKACADRPLVLVVEDLHWADRASRELFGYLARVSRGGSVLMIGTYRADELHRGHPLRPFVAELDRVRSVERLELERFDRAQTALQLRGILGREPEPNVVDEVYCRAEGNAFFTEEVACGVTCESAGPELSWSLRDLLMARVERLPELTQRLLRLLASAVQPAHPPLIAAVAELTEDELTEALRPAFAANVLVAGERETYRFRHALMREVVHGELLPGEHTRMYLRLAEVLDDNPTLVAADCLDVELAHYWYRAHVPDKALTAALFAAESARTRYAFADELAMFERALELWDQVPHEADTQPDDIYLMYRASLAAGRAGAMDRGLAFAEAGLAAIDEAARPSLAAHLFDQRSKHRRTLGRSSGLDDQLRAIELLREEQYAVKRGYMLTGLASTLSLHGRLSEALVAVDEAIELCARAGDPCDLLAGRLIRGTILVNAGRIEEGLAMQRAARVEAEQMGPTPTLLPRIDICLSSALYDVGHYIEAAEVARGGLRSMIPCDPIKSGMLHNNLAEPLIALGEWDEAARHTDDAIILNLPGVHDLALLRLRADLNILRGEYDKAQEDLDTARRRGGSKTDEPQYVIPLHRAVAALAAARGQIDHVRAAFQTLLDVGIREGDERYLWEMLALVARAEADEAVATGVVDPDSVTPHIERIAESLPVHTHVQRVHARQVVAEARRERQSESQDPAEWLELAAAADEAAAPVHLRAYLRFRLAEAAAVRGDRNQAARVAREARALVEHLGAKPLLEQIDALVRAARLALQPVPSTGAGAGTGTGTGASVGVGAGVGGTTAMAGRALAGVGRNASVGDAGPASRERVRAQGRDAAGQGRVSRAVNSGSSGSGGGSGGSGSDASSAGRRSSGTSGASATGGGSAVGGGIGSGGGSATGGGSDRGSDSSGSDIGAIGNLGLTPRELDVLRLVAEGLSNGQIGARLYITTKTVSVHVSNILAKLGVSSRTEAAAVAHRLRVFDIVA